MTPAQSVWLDAMLDAGLPEIGRAKYVELIERPPEEWERDRPARLSPGNLFNINASTYDLWRSARVIAPLGWSDLEYARLF